MTFLTAQEELILLAVHQLKDKAYLVTILEHLKENTRRNWSIGSVYVPLDRLRKKGILSVRIGRPTAVRGRNAVKYYDITTEGMRVLVEHKHVHDRMWKGFSAAPRKDSSHD